MTVTTLDPQTALIVVDLQKGVIGLPIVHPISSILENTRLLLDAFRSRGLPVVLVNAAGRAPGRTEAAAASTATAPAGAGGGVGAFALSPDWTDLVPELDQQPGDKTVTKRTWGAFMNTDLDAHLKNLGVTQVVVTGIATSAGVESTARQAHEHGYNVTVATDAVSDMNAELHRNSVERVFPRIGETGTTAEVVALLG